MMVMIAEVCHTECAANVLTVDYKLLQMFVFCQSDSITIYFTDSTFISVRPSVHLSVPVPPVLSSADIYLVKLYMRYELKIMKNISIYLF